MKIAIENYKNRVVTMSEMKVGEIGVIKTSPYEGTVVTKNPSYHQVNVVMALPPSQGNCWSWKDTDCSAPDIEIEILPPGTKIIIEI